MISVEEARALALGLPDAEELDDYGMTSFWVRGKIYATVPDRGHLRAMVDDDQIRALAASEPAVYSEKYWGKRLACVVVDLATVTPDALREVLVEAWLNKAPRRLARRHLGS